MAASHHVNIPGVPTSLSKPQDLSRLSPQELIRRLQHAEYDRIQALQEKSSLSQMMNQKLQAAFNELHIVKEANQKLHSENQAALIELRKIQDVSQKMQMESQKQSNEVHKVRELNQKLQKDCQELRDLCCYLDDDRQKCRKLAQEWQRFGHYTAAVMRKEVDAYQSKLDSLEQQQHSFLKENVELKELCLALDQETKEVNHGETSERDQGDGSSNSSAGEKVEELSPRSAEALSVLDAHTLDYIKSLETRVHLLENDRRVSQEMHAKKTTSPAEAVNKAMQVLEIHEQIETPAGKNGDDLDPLEKALLRQMCNVVWKKLGDDVPDSTTAKSFSNFSS